MTLLRKTPEGKATLAAKRDEVTDIVTNVLGKGTGNDAGLRMTAVFKLLQTKFSINVPPVISNFQSSQERLSVAMESMLRTMTNAEVARLDVILAAARKDDFDVGEIGGGDMIPAQVFAQKKRVAGAPPPRAVRVGLRPYPKRIVSITASPRASKKTED